VKGVTAAFRDGIYHTPAGLAKFGFVARAGHLEFLDDIFAKLKGDAGAANLLLEKSVVIVSAVDHVIVEVAGHPVKADHSEIAVRRRARSEQHKVSEIAAIQRESLDAVLVHHAAKRGLGRVDERGVGIDADGDANVADLQQGSHGGRCPDTNLDVLHLGPVETVFFD